MENYDATPATMKTSASMEMTIGLTVMLVSVSAAMHLDAGGLGLLLCFTGFLVGASLVGVGVRTADGPPPIVPVVFASSARALAAFVRRKTAVVGVVVASCAVTMLVSGDGEAHPVLCFATFALLLLGVSLISIGARGE